MELTILRPGTFTDSNGEEVSFDVATLEEVADAYDTDLREAPIVLGHPTDDQPAYGWVESLRVEGERLVASVRAVHDNVREWIKDEHYRYLSASLWHPESSETGTWYLRHVGLLGAAPPAVAGLGPVELADDDGVVMLCADMPAGVTSWADVEARMRQFFDTLLSRAMPAEPPTDSSSSTNLAAMESLAEMLSAYISDSSKDESELIAEMAEAAGVTSGTMREIISGDMMRPGDDVLAGIASVVDDVTVEELMEMLPEEEESTDMNAREAELRARERRIKAKEKRLQKKEQQAAEQRAHDFADSLADAGKILPRHVPAVASIYQSVSSHGGTVDLSAHGGGEQVDAKEAVEKLFDELGETVDFSEASAADGPTPEEERTATDLAKEARAYQAEQKRNGNKISAAEAVQHVKTKR